LELNITIVNHFQVILKYHKNWYYNKDQKKILADNRKKYEYKIPDYQLMSQEDIGARMVRVFKIQVRIEIFILIVFFSIVRREFD
jgi:hypothetical protein